MYSPKKFSSQNKFIDAYTPSNMSVYILQPYLGVNDMSIKTSV